jgi:ornithine carbamoyltransferase
LPRNSRVPVINGLTNEFHPCQILADIFTYIEHRGSIKGKVVAWVGDGNNMANTWLQAAELLGFTVHVSTPSGYEVDHTVAGIRSGQLQGVQRPDGSLPGRRPGDHRRLDQHGL